MKPLSTKFRQSPRSVRWSRSIPHVLVVSTLLVLAGTAAGQVESAIAPDWDPQVAGWSLDSEAVVDDFARNELEKLAGRHDAECELVEGFTWELDSIDSPADLPGAFMRFDQALMMLSAALMMQHGDLIPVRPYRGMSMQYLATTDNRVFGLASNGQSPSGLTRHLTLCRAP